MPLENAQWIAELVPANPEPGDVVGQGDDHLRLTKTVLANTFVGDVINGDIWDSTGGALLVGPQGLNDLYDLIKGGDGITVPLVLANNVPLQGRNAANDASLDIVKINTDDQVVVGGGDYPVVVERNGGGSTVARFVSDTASTSVQIIDTGSTANSSVVIKSVGDLLVLRGGDVDTLYVIGGKVGIGTTNPSEMLSLDAINQEANIVIQPASDNFLAVNWGGILINSTDLSGSGAGIKGSIRAVNAGSVNGSSVAWQFNIGAGGGIGNDAEAMLIGSDGNVTVSIGDLTVTAGNLTVTEGLTVLTRSSATEEVLRISGAGAAGTYLRINEAGIYNWYVGIDDGLAVLNFRGGAIDGDIGLSISNNNDVVIPNGSLTVTSGTIFANELGGSFPMALKTDSASVALSMGNDTDFVKLTYTAGAYIIGVAGSDRFGTGSVEAMQLRTSGVTIPNGDLTISGGNNILLDASGNVEIGDAKMRVTANRLIMNSSTLGFRVQDQLGSVNFLDVNSAGLLTVLSNLIVTGGAVTLGTTHVMDNVLAVGAGLSANISYIGRTDATDPDQNSGDLVYMVRSSAIRRHLFYAGNPAALIMTVEDTGLFVRQGNLTVSAGLLTVVNDSATFNMSLEGTGVEGVYQQFRIPAQFVWNVGVNKGTSDFEITSTIGGGAAISVSPTSNVTIPTGTLTVSGGNLTVSGGNLTVSGETNPEINVIDTTNSATVGLQATDASGILRTASNHQLLIRTNNLDAIIISTAQDVELPNGNLTVSDGTLLVDNGVTEGLVTIEGGSGSPTAVGRLSFDFAGVSVSAIESIRNTANNTADLNFYTAVLGVLTLGLVIDLDQNVIIPNGDLTAIGTATFQSGFEPALIIGADAADTNLTDGINKLGKMGTPHRDNLTEEPVTILSCTGGGTNNILAIGGGTGTLNACTQVNVFSAADNTTLLGTQITRVDIGGLEVTAGDMTVVSLSGGGLTGASIDNDGKLVRT